MFEIINKARVIWSMLSGNPIRFKSKQSGTVYSVKYIPKFKEFEIKNDVGAIVDEVEII